MSKSNMPDSSNSESQPTPIDTAKPPGSRSKELLVPRLLASLISLTLVGLGIMSVVTQSYYGRTFKLGGAEVSLSGGQAVGMGLATIFLGLLPLAFWFSSKRPALAWALVCVAAAALPFVVSTYAGKP